MRKCEVSYSKWHQKARQQGVEGFKEKAIFHKWGEEIHETNEGMKSETVAVIELEDGSVQTALPSQIVFLDKVAI